jgi:hypothetical protein
VVDHEAVVALEQAPVWLNSERRMCQLVRRRGPIRQRTFPVTFAAAGAAAYGFTFG